MALVIGVVSQKGGVGKSTCARLIAREYAHAGWDVKIADLDVSQGTSFDWHVRRLQQQLEPSVAVERFGTVEQALKSMFRSAAWLLRRRSAPRAICPGGILIPVCASLLSSTTWRVPFINSTQLKPPVPAQLLGAGVASPAAGVLLNRCSRASPSNGSAPLSRR